MTADAITDFDLYLFGEGRHERIYDKLGAHLVRIDGRDGVRFAVWAPNAESVSVVGPFNDWDGRRHPLRGRGVSGVWEGFVPGLGAGTAYKYELRSRDGRMLLKSDPYAFASQLRPGNCSVVASLEGHRWRDAPWLERRGRLDPRRTPISIFEVHLGSWRRPWHERSPPFMSWSEAAEQLIPYALELGYTHLELMGVAEHPLDASWGYQVTGYYAPTSRYGGPLELMDFIDRCHEAGLGVILDWVPAHFPRDEHGLASFDGTALYEHADARLGEHADWGTKIFNYGRHEVRNFLTANALYWFDRFHVDGLRVDAVASMLYLDYSRRPGEWLPNRHGGRENIEAIDFLREMNDAVHRAHPGVITIAEESTAFPGVSQPPEHGGLGFNFKWNMGWMNDTLKYFSMDPVHRRWNHQLITFSFMYAWSENFILPISHDEVVHGKRALLDKMPGDDWQKRANFRLLLAYMTGHPGKRLLFMGSEFGQWREWRDHDQLDWPLAGEATHAALRDCVRELNRLYEASPQLHSGDCEPEGFRWIDLHNAEESVFAFQRNAVGGALGASIVCAFNATPVPRGGYRLGVPAAGEYRKILDTDEPRFGGSGYNRQATVASEAEPWQGFPCSIRVDLPPLGAVFLLGPG
ncbi:MAG: 1,4-alpha-glucan branching protein GlgB [Gammaproteobacteria bacterium]|nr:1,4-alpha-glucan branching protein GlgB [Gammaproteobacteria bacterium]